jgi:hypothetical protein
MNVYRCGLGLWRAALSRLDAEEWEGAKTSVRTTSKHEPAQTVPIGSKPRLGTPNLASDF